ncbi:MAG: GGDEF domain-containing protein [Gammaproteobacteria bacterium]
MLKVTEIPDIFNIEQLELKGFTRSIAEIEWLLLILVILYFVSPGAKITDPYGVVLSMVAFAVFTLGFHYLNFFTLPARWKIAIETWAMILFLTWVLWNTGKVDSPLLNLYLLVIIASALSLGRLVTFLEFALITAVYFYLDYHVYGRDIFSAADFSDFMTKFAPFLLIAYVTTMLASDVQYGKELFRHLSETDEMTGLLNKRSFNMTLIKEVKKAARYSRPFSIMLVDADNLKQVNDRFGHEAGDRLIKMLANTMQECLRISDVVARYGGDEFIILLPETDYKHARDASERIRSAVDHTSFDMNGDRVTTTVSVGVAGYPEDATDIKELVEKADKALYRSKNSGRNKVTLFSEMIVRGNDTKRDGVASVA